MNETLLTSIDQVLDIKAESQFEIYCSIGDQLVKEFFIERAGCASYLESASANVNKNNGPFNDDGRIPTLTKIGDWFSRFVTRLRAWFLKNSTLKKIEKITKMPIYKDSNPDAMIKCIFPSEDWFTDLQKGYFTLCRTMSKEVWNHYIETESSSLITLLTNDYNRGILQRRVKTANKRKEEALDLWNDVKKITAINSDSAKVHTDVRKEDLDEFLRNLKISSEKLGENIKKAYESKGNIVKLCKIEIGKANIKDQQTWEKISEQYVKLITDIARTWLYEAQIEWHIVNRILYSLQKPSNSDNNGV